MRLCFDYGHGGKDSGACYKGRRESDDVLEFGMELASYLRSYGILVDETRTSDMGVTLSQRCQFENKKNYDYFISFHRNAYRPELARGAETFIYLNGNPKAHSLAKHMQKALSQIGFRDRGVKKANFYVLRKTRAPALLLELGFIDQSQDNALFDQKKEQIIRALGQVILVHSFKA